MKVPSPNSNSQTLNSIPRVGSKYRDEATSRKLVQKQLILLLHANHCLKQQKKEVGKTSHRQCAVPHCDLMKEVWTHIKSCTNGTNCTYLHCSSSIKILSHWRNCLTVDCSVCQLIRQKVKSKNGSGSKSKSEDESEESQTKDTTTTTTAVNGSGTSAVGSTHSAIKDGEKPFPVLLGQEGSAFRRVISHSYINSVLANASFSSTAVAVRRAYEDIGIPCPPHALSRLLMTLPIMSSYNSTHTPMEQETSAASSQEMKETNGNEDEGYDADPIWTQNDQLISNNIANEKPRDLRVLKGIPQTVDDDDPPNTLSMSRILSRDFNY